MIAFLKSSHQTLKSISTLQEENVNTSYNVRKQLMSNVQITKQHKNATTDKLNLNPPLIHKEVSLIFRWLKFICSLTLLDNFKPSKNQATKKWKWVFTPPPRETQAGECEVIVPAFPSHAWGGVRVSNDWCITLGLTIQNSCSSDWLFLVKKADEWTLILWLLVRVRTIKDLALSFLL